MIALALGLLCPAGSARGQTAPPPVDTTGLAEGPWSSMTMLYERTIFHVDVLTLELRFGEATARRLEKVTKGRRYSEALADSVASVALDAGDVLVRSHFERNVGLDQFLGGLEDSLEKARRAGILSEEAQRVILADVSVQYEPLRAEGIHEGDVMWYRIRGDSLHVAFQRRDGSVPVEERPVGKDRRLGVLGGYLAPRSDFREKLIRSLFEGQGP